MWTAIFGRGCTTPAQLPLRNLKVDNEIELFVDSPHSKPSDTDTTKNPTTVTDLLMQNCHRCPDTSQDWGALPLP